MTQETFNLMALTLDDEWLEETVRLEEEAGCSASAGFDWGASGGAYLASTQASISPEKLMRFLEDELGQQLSQAELESIAADVQRSVRQQLVNKIKPESESQKREISRF